MMKYGWVVLLSLLCVVLVVDEQLSRPSLQPYEDKEQLKEEVLRSPCLTRVVRKTIETGELSIPEYMAKYHDYAKEICFSKT